MSKRMFAVLAIVLAAAFESGCSKQDIEELQSRATATETKVKALESKADTLGTTVNGVQSKAAATETGMQTLKSEVEKLVAERAEMQKRLEALEEKTKCLKGCPVKEAPKVKSKPAAKVAAPKPAPAAAKAAPKPAPVISETTMCPSGWFVRAYAWSLQQMSGDLRKEVERHMAAAKMRDSMTGLPVYGTDALSRVLGLRLWQELKTPAPVNADVTVRFVDGSDSSTGKLVHKDAGVLRMVNGVGDFRLPEDPRKHLATEFVWPDRFVSPERSGPPSESSQPRLKVLTREVKTCGLLVTGIVP